jgi:hypothetical protein
MRVQQFLTSYWEQFTPSNLFRIDIDKSLCHCERWETYHNPKKIIMNIQGRGGEGSTCEPWVGYDKLIHNSWIGAKLEAASACPPRNWYLHDAAIAPQQKPWCEFLAGLLALRSRWKLEQARQKIELCWRPSSAQQEFPWGRFWQFQNQLAETWIWVIRYFSQCKIFHLLRRVTPSKYALWDLSVLKVPLEIDSSSDPQQKNSSELWSVSKKQKKVCTCALHLTHVSKVGWR